MQRKYKFGLILAGSLAGSVAGLFGAGGGMVLVPMLTASKVLDENEVFPSSISIIFPICLVCLVMTAMAVGLPIRNAFPYLIGSAVGGFLAGQWGKSIPVKWLHRGLGILILWGGLRYLWH